MLWSHDHHRARVLATAGAAIAHGYLAVIGFIGYLDYTVGTPYVLMEIVAGQRAWTWIHGGTAIVLAASLFAQHRRFRDMPVPAIACIIGFATMLVWAFFNFLWGLSTVRPVSLAGPGLAFVVAAGEQLLANAWNRRAQTKER